MRILHIISTISPEAGGPSEGLRTILECLPPGYTSEIVCLDEPDADFIRNFPCTVHALGGRKTTFGYSPRLDRWLRANRDRFDGVMINGLWGYINIAARRAFRGRKPYVVFTHGMLDPYFKRAFPLKHAKKWIYWHLAEYWNLRGAYRTLFTTKAEAQLAKESFRLHKWNEAVIPYGAHRPPKDGAILQEAFYQRYPALRNIRFMLFLGRIHRKKGCDLLIESFIKNAAADPDLHLVMAGPNQEGWSTELKYFAAAAGLIDRIHWPGMLKGDIKWGAFYASEVFILPSHQENFGIAVAESLSCGRPVLLADKVNIAPEIAAAGAGYMELDTQEGTDNLVRRWIETSAADRADMSARGLNLFAEKYDLRQSAALIFHLFDDVASK